MMARGPNSTRPRKALGPGRPSYLDHGDVDRVMSVLLALVSEVASIRDRLDTHERLAQADQPSTPAAVEGYAPDSTVEQQREDWRDSYIRRLFRVIMEDVEALKGETTDRATDPD